jgi:ketosteroid isomerase-like protein
MAPREHRLAWSGGDWRRGTMAEHPNAELFRRGYTAFQNTDLDGVRALFDSNIVWHIGGHNHNSGDFTGPDNVIATFMQNAQETNGTFKVELHDVLGSDEHAVALATVSGEKDGKTLNDNYTHVVHVANGKVTESWIFPEHGDTVDEFWG